MLVRIKPKTPTAIKMGSMRRVFSRPSRGLEDENRRAAPDQNNERRNLRRVEVGVVMFRMLPKVPDKSDESTNSSKRTFADEQLRSSGLAVAREPHTAEIKTER
jgi:hypothetical protein